MCSTGIPGRYCLVSVQVLHEGGSDDEGSSEEWKVLPSWTVY